MLKLDQKYYMWGIAHEFKIIMLKLDQKYYMWGITHEFKIVMLTSNHKFHIEFIFLSLMASSCF
jgi:hypothetical protein